MRLHSRRTMITLSHVIEEQAALGGTATVLIATFQRLSLYAVEAARYRRFALQFAQVYVLGVADAPVPDVPNVTVVPLERNWPLVQEWSVIASGPQVAVGLLALDAVGFRPEQRSRSFEGLFTTDPALIDAAVARFYAALTLPQPAFERDNRATSRNTEAVRRALAARIS
ncbi:MAG TPA: DICT sensory domain-containing protein [Roseiflexaceae bacterium]|nr:DICT sensory domain-containing protein [Roseiflexaceae bacterium]HMP42728.1 DICT sensory domain-containing protein [Roseiflexaceae bacterium]